MTTRYGLARHAIASIMFASLMLWLVSIPWGEPIQEGTQYDVAVGFVDTDPPTTVEAPKVTTASSAPTTTIIAPSTTPPATAPPGDWQCPDAIAAAITVGWPADELATLDAIIWRESRCDPNAYNGRNLDRSYGYLQINTKGGLWPDRRDLCSLGVPPDLWDPHINLRCGLILWRRSNWSPWGGAL